MNSFYWLTSWYQPVVGTHHGWYSPQLVQMLGLRSCQSDAVCSSGNMLGNLFILTLSNWYQPDSGLFQITWEWSYRVVCYIIFVSDTRHILLNVTMTIGSHSFMWRVSLVEVNQANLSLVSLWRQLLRTLHAGTAGV